MAHKSEQTPTLEIDPCEHAYSIAIFDIYQNAGDKKSFEERVLMPIVGAAQEVETSATTKLSRAEKHRLQTEITYDVLWRLRDAGELDEEDQITWRQTDEKGEEWVEYTNASGEVFALNCPGLKYGFGKIETNKLDKKYDKLFERSYEYENDYDIVKKLYKSRDGLGKHNKYHNPTKRRRLWRALGGVGIIAAGGVLGFGITTMADSALKNVPARTTSTMPEATAPASPETTTTPTSLPVEASPLVIMPRENFVDKNTNTLLPADYSANISKLGNNIKFFERPTGEGLSIGKQINGTPADTLTSAEIPQIITPQIAEYASNNPDFIPTAIRGTERGKKNSYWNGKPAGAFQKAGFHEFGTSAIPGEIGNAFLVVHASTKNVGGGDLAAQRTGDILELDRSVDGNKYKFMFVEKEIIDVDSEGNLTPAERKKWIARGYDNDVAFTDIAYNYLGHKNDATLTIQACGNLDGTAGGKDGGNDAADARVLYRYVLVDGEIKKQYNTTPLWLDPGVQAAAKKAVSNST